MATNEMLSLDDEHLVALTLDGNNQAFSEIIRRYQGMVARTIKGMLGNIQQAEDVGQETFIRLYNSLADFRGEAKLGTYIQRIAINLSLNEIKRRGRSKSLFFQSDADDEPTRFDLPSSDYEKSADAKEIVDAALRKLNPEFRAVVTLRMLQGYSTAETAEILNMPIGTVLSRLSRAREKLKEILEKLI
jgi:RNA polymerase sigma-70 factor (ECF subfamily)